MALPARAGKAQFKSSDFEQNQEILPYFPAKTGNNLRYNICWGIGLKEAILTILTYSLNMVNRL
jgi:hypothetical protein